MALETGDTQLDTLSSALLRRLVDVQQRDESSTRARRPIREVAFHDFADYRFLLRPRRIHFVGADPGLGEDQPVNMDEWIDFQLLMELFPGVIHAAILETRHVDEVMIELEDGSFYYGSEHYLDIDTVATTEAVPAVARFFDAFRQTMGLAIFELFQLAADKFAFADRARYVVQLWLGDQLRRMVEPPGIISREDIARLESVEFWTAGIPAVLNGLGEFARAAAPEAKEQLFGERLPPAYSFTPLQPGSVNFGFRIIYRQTWTPLGTQAGEVVRTLPLGPRQSEKIGVKVVNTRKSARSSETARSVETSTEATATSRDSTDVVNEASSKFHWDLNADIGGIPLGETGGTAGIDGGMGGELSGMSRETKNFLNETMSKTASHMRSDTKLVVTTEREEVDERTQLSEIVNPNDEIAVTYVYSRLQRQYEIQSYLAEATAVVYVAEKMPAPREITPDWIRRYDWVIGARLLDESFRADLEVIRSQEAASDSDEPIDWRIQRLMESLSGARLADSSGIPADYAGMPGTMPDLYQNMQQAYEREVERERARRAQRERYLRSARRLRAHIYDNILHYCRAIWSSEDAGARLMRLRAIRVPVRWEFIATGAPGAFTIEGQFAPAVEEPAQDVRMLSEIVDMSGPIGYCGNYSVYRLRMSEEWQSLVDMVNLARLPYMSIEVEGEAEDAALQSQWRCIGAASPSRQEARRYRLVHVATPQPAFRVLAEQAGSVYVEVETIDWQPGRPVTFQGVKVWIEPLVPGAVLADGHVFLVRVRVLPVLEDPERRAIRWSSGPLSLDQEASFYTAEILQRFVEYFADCAEALREVEAAKLRWDTLAPEAREVLRSRYFDYLLRSLHTQRILVDSNDLILTREVDTTSSLEPFKSVHRFVDVLAAFEDMSAKRLENERYSARLAGGRLGDPNVENMTVLAAATNLRELVAVDELTRSLPNPAGGSAVATP